MNNEIIKANIPIIIFPLYCKTDAHKCNNVTVSLRSKFIRDGMAEIAKTLNFNKKVTNMICRPTTATILKHSGASAEYTREVFDHMDKRTTEIYPDSFGKEVKKEFSEKPMALGK